MVNFEKKFEESFNLHKKGKIKEALETYLKILPEQKNNSKLNYLIGVIYLQSKNFELAVDFFEKTINLDKNNLGAYNNLGASLQQLRRFEQAVKVYEKVLSLKPDFTDALNNLATCFANLKKYDQAISYFEKILKINKNNSVVYNNLGNIYKELNQHKKSIENYNKALEINPNYHLTYLNLGDTLIELKDYNGALINYKNLIKLSPKHYFIEGKILHTNMQICNWENYENDIKNLIQSLEKHEKIIDPFSIISLTEKADHQKRASEIFSNYKFPTQLENKINSDKNNLKTRLGYFSPDFCDHPVLHLIFDVFKNHNKNKFEIFAFSFGPRKKDEMTGQVKKYFNEFIDINDKSDEEVAMLSRKMDIDIAIDLCGFTNFNRAGIFSHRAAPLQVNFLGYPGTMGSTFIDYLIADRIVIPEDQKLNYSENIAYLPNCYQPNMAIKNISKTKITRNEEGLPVDAFVFCNFNSNYKITPQIFEVWMNILKNVSNSVLWLLETNNESSKNIIKEAKKNNISENRIIFAKHLPNKDHLKRIELADIFLDTFPYSAHTTASDFVRVGIPLITLKGESFASRVASSILNQVNLNELVTKNKNEYQELAISIGMDNEKLKNLKEKLKGSISDSNLFNSVLYTKHLEDLFINLSKKNK
tara:strand:+ start:93 stop:2036 length:1944 start_codon:yes stop_codon:yes gene_type:complete